MEHTDRYHLVDFQGFDMDGLRDLDDRTVYLILPKKVGFVFLVFLQSIYPSHEPQKHDSREGWEGREKGNPQFRKCYSSLYRGLLESTLIAPSFFSFPNKKEMNEVFLASTSSAMFFIRNKGKDRQTDRQTDELLHTSLDPVNKANSVGENFI